MVIRKLIQWKVWAQVGRIEQYNKGWNGEPVWNVRIWKQPVKQIFIDLLFKNFKELGILLPQWGLLY